MSKQVAKHHRKAARRERVVRHALRVRGGRPAAAKKLIARRKHVLGTAAEQQQSGKAPQAYANPAAEAVEVIEVEVVSVPEVSLEVTEAAPALPENAFLEEDE